MHVDSRRNLSLACASVRRLRKDIERSKGLGPPLRCVFVVLTVNKPEGFERSILLSLASVSHKPPVSRQDNAATRLLPPNMPQVPQPGLWQVLGYESPQPTQDFASERSSDLSSASVRLLFTHVGASSTSR